jgi:hypothetical protein
MPGSTPAPLLIRPEARAFVVVEAELDGMLAAQAACAAGLDCGALAVLTNRGKPDAAAHRALQGAAAILLALDFDQPDAQGNRAGIMGLPWWQETYPALAERWPVPEGKDPGDYAALGHDLGAWIRAGLEEAAPALALTVGRLATGRKDSGRGVSQQPVRKETPKAVAKLRKYLMQCPVACVFRDGDFWHEIDARWSAKYPKMAEAFLGLVAMPEVQAWLRRFGQQRVDADTLRQAHGRAA